MNFYAKHFNDLTNRQLYQILRLRSQVFVVEQNCLYLDIDNHDQNAYHIWMEDEEENIIAYLRIVPAKEIFDNVSIGRVLCMDRGKGYASKLLTYSLSFAKEQLHVNTIELEAQTYARGLYEKAGFVQTGSEFLEDGIPHIPCVLNYK